MNLRDLGYLLALDKYRHFRKAAHHSYVSQPTLSGQIKKLETELGVILIERGYRKVVFTEVGKKVLEHARRVLDETQKITTLAKHYKDPSKGELHLALIPTVGPYLLPLITASLKRAFPELNLVLYEYQTGKILEALRAGNIDAGVLALPLKQDGLEEIPCYREPFALAVPKGHSLSREKSVDADGLQDEPVFLLEEGHCFRDQALKVCEKLGVSEKRGYRATSLETLRYMVGMGEGVTMAPRLVEHQWKQSQSPPLVFLPFKPPVPSREVGLIFRKGSVRRDVFQKISVILKESVRNVLGRVEKDMEVLGVKDS